MNHSLNSIFWEIFVSEKVVPKNYGEEVPTGCDFGIIHFGNHLISVDGSEPVSTDRRPIQSRKEENKRTVSYSTDIFLDCLIFYCKDQNQNEVRKIDDEKKD